MRLVSKSRYGIRHVHISVLSGRVCQPDMTTLWEVLVVTDDCLGLPTVRYFELLSLLSDELPIPWLFACQLH
jgi:hypothetical protein